MLLLSIMRAHPPAAHRQAAENLRAQTAAQQRPGNTPLPYSPIQGNWQAMSDQIAWKLHNHEYREASSLL